MKLIWIAVLLILVGCSGDAKIEGLEGPPAQDAQQQGVRVEQTPFETEPAVVPSNNEPEEPTTISQNPFSLSTSAIFDGTTITIDRINNQRQEASLIIENQTYDVRTGDLIPFDNTQLYVKKIDDEVELLHIEEDMVILDSFNRDVVTPVGTVQLIVSNFGVLREEPIAELKNSKIGMNERLTLSGQTLFGPFAITTLALSQDRERAIVQIEYEQAEELEVYTDSTLGWMGDVFVLASYTKNGERYTLRLENALTGATDTKIMREVGDTLTLSGETFALKQFNEQTIIIEVQ